MICSIGYRLGRPLGQLGSDGIASCQKTLMQCNQRTPEGAKTQMRRLLQNARTIPPGFLPLLLIVKSAEGS